MANSAPFARLAARIAQQKTPPSGINKTPPGGTPGRQPSSSGFASQGYGSRPVAPPANWQGIAPPASWRQKQASGSGFPSRKYS